MKIALLLLMVLLSACENRSDRMREIQEQNMGLSGSSTKTENSQQPAETISSDSSVQTLEE